MTEAPPSPNPAVDLPIPPPIKPEHTLSGPQWGMVSFLASEVALFSTLLVTYITFIGKDRVGPTPAEALSLPLVLFNTACLLASSFTIHMAEHGLLKVREEFLKWWAATIVLGTIFLLGTAYEWHDLIYNKHLTISRNLFGSTFYTVVGFHALHVTIGVVVLTIVFGLAVRRQISAVHRAGVELVSWYWHFVDVVWVVVFFIVYVFGR